MTFAKVDKVNKCLSKMKGLAIIKSSSATILDIDVTCRSI